MHLMSFSAFQNKYFQIIRVFLWLIILFSLSRLFFYVLNNSYFGQVPADLFFKGILFDISIICYLNIIVFAIVLFPLPLTEKKTVRIILHIIFVLVNSIALAANCIDAKFFEFEQKRLTADIFSPVWLGEDFVTLIPAFIADYWYIIAVWFIFLFVLIKIFPSEFYLSKRLHWISQTGFLILFTGLMALGARGSTGLKPLRLLTAGKYASPKNIPLLINSPFSIIHTLGDNSLNMVSYFDDDSLHRYYGLERHFQNDKPAKRNIVIIILESFSREYIGFYNNGKGYTPFLDSLMHHSLVFNNAFANGKKSIEALPSIISSIPALMDVPYITSKYSGNQIHSIASALGEMGYISIFYHGGKNGTMGFNIFCKLAGFNYYSGLDQYPYKNDYDGNWGIYDEPYLKFVAGNMDTLPEPFLSCIFTLSSHHPYQIPEKYRNRFPKGRLVNHQSIAYADYALSKFFDVAKQKSWYKNTLFVLTADHTAQSEGGFYAGKVGMYAVPIVLFSPSDSLLKGIDNTIARHIDIMPTILHYTGYSKPFLAFGCSLFEEIPCKVNYTYINGIYQAFDSSYVIFFNGTEVLGYFNYQNDSLLKTNLFVAGNKNAIGLENKLKAVIQLYNRGMIKNRLHISAIKTEKAGI